MMGQDNLRIAIIGALGFVVLQITIAFYGIGSVVATFSGPWFIGVVMFYVAYLGIRRSRILYSPIYRRQARGIAFVSVGASIVFFTGAMNGAVVLGNPLFVLIQGEIPWVWLLILFYWVDVSARAGKRSDPIARDTFHWQSIRLPLWAANAGAVVIGSIIEGYFFATGNITGITGPPPSTSTVVFILIAIMVNLPQVLTLGAGLILLPIVARRAKDGVLRRHLVWFGVFALVFVLSTVTFALKAAFLPSNAAFCPYGYVELAGKCVLATIPSSVLQVEIVSESVVYGMYLLAAICLSQSVRSLVPLTEIEPSEGGEFVPA